MFGGSIGPAFKRGFVDVREPTRKGKPTIGMGFVIPTKKGKKFLKERR